MSKARAFTLVELLVVIGIIAILVGILLPTLNRARGSAQETNCLSNMRQIGVGFLMHSDDNKGFLPLDLEDGNSAGNRLAGPDNRGWDEPKFWINAVPRLLGSDSYNERQRRHLLNEGERLPTAGDSDIFMCAAATTPLSTSVNHTYPNEPYFRMWGLTVPEEQGGTRISTAVEARPQYIAFAYNSKLVPSGPPSLNQDKAKLVQARPSSEFVLMVEKRMVPGEVTAEDDAYYQQQGFRGATNRLRTRDLNRLKADWQRFTSRHRGGGMVLFADGHVTWHHMREVLTTFDPSATPVDWNQPGKFRWTIRGIAE